MAQESYGLVNLSFQNLAQLHRGSCRAGEGLLSFSGSPFYLPTTHGRCLVCVPAPSPAGVFLPGSCLCGLPVLVLDGFLGSASLLSQSLTHLPVRECSSDLPVLMFFKRSLLLTLPLSVQIDHLT